MNEYYFEYKEGENHYCGIVTAPNEHVVNDQIRQQLSDVDWATEQGGEFVGLYMFTPVYQIDDVDKYIETQENLYTVDDWKERLERAERIRMNDGENTIQVVLDE